MLGVAGGDGSLAAVAAVAIERGLPFVCVPYGTRNHFARDLGLDRNDPVGALDAFAGAERRIDVGRVGDQLFLNNVSLGLYAGLVHRREHHRRRRDVLARARALALSLRHRHRSRFEIDGATIAARLVLVANNAYALDVFNLGARERLDEGLLHLYVPEGVVPSRWHDRAAESFTIDVSRHRTRAAIDGEPITLETPLEFRVERAALLVRVPRAPG
jgi:diacylglycerol kinase family enzyme